MDRLERIDRFLSVIAAAPDFRSLFKLVEAEIKRLGFERYTYRLLALPNGARPDCVSTNYPAEWLTRYRAENYEADDAIFHRMAESTRPIIWSEVIKPAALTSAQQRIFNEGADFGVVSGVSVPLWGPGAVRSRFGVASSGRPEEIEKLYREHRHELQIMATYVHERALALVADEVPEQRVNLTAREIEVLKWTAAGKTSWETANILTVTEATVKEHLGNVCRKFGVKSRTHAVALGIWRGYLTP
ncbi:MAG: LuxR family transcriptional regulator [Phenylobacterium sp.]|uniref:LuxR family transcriptional regulator n=1 Tax=Phenylobacterium sp. TaxID=1871053 RepID=UPI001A47B94D|nr:LuxR family transcriptional regulator [Phenylobacterium sp.]MBL8554604.1 LuxR family transcriptional regulator [Phenylobacterium sp.]